MKLQRAVAVVAVAAVYSASPGMPFGGNPSATIFSHYLTAAAQTIWTDRTRTLSLTHVLPGNDGAVWTDNERWVKVVAKCNIDEIFLPADWAFSRMLRAHLT